MGSGGTVASTPECADAGLTCLSCCKDVHGEIAFGAFVGAIKWCACGGQDAGCIKTCSPICEPSGSVPAECTICIHEQELSPCIGDNCQSASCQKYLACVMGCG